VSENRPHPPSQRRLAEARRAGRIAWSPALVGAAAIAGGAAAVAAIGAAWLDAAGAALAAGATASGSADPISAASSLRARDVIADLAALVVPLLVLAAAAAVLAHLAQTRGLWIPRRRTRQLPPAVDDAARRTGLAALASTRGAAVAIVAGTVVATSAALLAAHAGRSAAATGALFGTLAISVLAAAAATAVALGAIDWLERARRLRADLSMSARDLRDERRETEADPRWLRARARADDDDLAVRTALVVVVADDLAAALAWHPRWQPVPHITAAARGRAALRLTALARRHRIPIHRDVPLATELATLSGRPAPDHLHPALARLIVAVSPQG
jgi:flagellar biosynthesis protein FlhB